jgi:L-threonylcarbamoyladenylate synthase
LTLILPRAAHVLDAVTGGQPTVGIRMPSHPVALELLQAFGGGVVAPSANRFGQLSPTRVETLDPALLAHVAGVLAGGPCTVGVESTIVDCTGAEPVVLRPGMIDTARLEAVLGQPVRSRQQVAQQETVSRVPGDLPSHYAPRTPLVLVDDLTARLTQSAGRRVGGVVVAGDAVPQGEHWIVLPADAEGYARELYAALAALDQQGLEEIWVAVPPVGVAWEAVHDRLRRAAAPRPGVHHMVVSVGGGDPS